MPETRKAFHEELGELRADVIRLGAMVVEAIQAATDALSACDLTKAEEVIASGTDPDMITEAIEDRCYQLLARQQPMAVDLRTIVGILRVNHELELTAHLMVSVAKAARRLYPNRLDPKLRGIIDRMREQATAQLALAVDAFADADHTKAAALADMNENMGDLQKDLFRAILSAEHVNEMSLQRAVQVALVARFFERTGDHAVNIGDRVSYMVTGHLPSVAAQV